MNEPSGVPDRCLATAWTPARMEKRAPMEKPGARGERGAKTCTVRFWKLPI